ncbi:MAG: nucleoside hydrolase [Chloroflexi bacterium]|nr:nucleoside hydrolase [Chloroflexota bacterium]
MPKPLIFFSHDGGVDDYLSILLLMSMEHVDVIGIAVTPADCYIEPAVGATRKILDLMGRSEVTVAAAAVRGVNPFPRQFRRASFSIDLFPILNERDEIRAPLATETGQEFIVRTLREAREPVVFLETGPLTALAAALDLAPDIESKIKELVWMGGALNAPGNIDPVIEGGQDVSAEWNVYWDPFSAERIWRTNIPIVMTPLDVTNTMMLNRDFVLRLAKQRRHPISDLAGLCYSLVMNQVYYMWDVLTTGYIGRPDLYTLKEWETEIVTTGPSQGRTKVTRGGRKVRAVDSVEKERFFKYVLEQWQR